MTCSLWKKENCPAKFPLATDAKSAIKLTPQDIFSFVWKRTPLNQTLPEPLSQYRARGPNEVVVQNLFEQALDLGGTFSSIESVAIGRWARYGDEEGPSFKVSFQALIYGRRTDCQLKLSSPVPSLKEEMKNWCRN